jgi:hypothetical protein
MTTAIIAETENIQHSKWHTPEPIYDLKYLFTVYTDIYWMSFLPIPCLYNILIVEDMILPSS